MTELQYETRTVHPGKSIIEGGITTGDWRERQLDCRLITTAEELSVFNFEYLDKITYDIVDFIQTTDFTTSCLVLYQEWPKLSVPEWTVSHIERQNEELRIEIVPQSTDTVTEDLALENLLVRVSIGEPPPPTTVHITGNNHNREQRTYSTTER